MKQKLSHILFAAGVAVPTLAASVTAAGAAQAPSLLIVHGIQGTDLGAGNLPTLPIDVKIDHTCVTKQPVDFGSVLGPYPLSVGAHTVRISLASISAPCSGTAILTAHSGLAAGEQHVLIAAQNTSGGATTEEYDLSEGVPVPTGVARAVMFHTADAPAVDITITTPTGATQAFNNLAPGQRVAGDVPGFTSLAVRVLAAGTSTVVAGPIGFNASYRSIEALFVVGNAADGDVTVISKEIHAVY